MRVCDACWRSEHRRRRVEDELLILPAARCAWFLGQRLLFGGEAAFDFLHVLGRRQLFGFDFAAAEQLADFAVVLDVLAGDLGFGVQVVALDAEVGDLVGEVLGFDRDRGQEVGQRAAFGHAEAASSFAAW